MYVATKFVPHPLWVATHIYIDAFCDQTWTPNPNDDTSLVAKHRYLDVLCDICAIFRIRETWKI